MIVGVGQEWRGVPARKATVRIFDCAFFKRILLRHDTGLGESYLAGEFEVRLKRNAEILREKYLGLLCTILAKKLMSQDC